jgi:hypothetical protein
MKRRLLAGDALHDDAAVFSNKNSHIVTSLYVNSVSL